MVRQFTWTAADGTQILLNDSAAGYEVKAAGSRGLTAPSYRLARSIYAGIDGSRMDSVQADERQFTLGLKVWGPTASVFRARWRGLTRALRPKSGPGSLTVADELGDTRTIACYYAGGLEGDAEAEFSGIDGRAVIQFVAPDPWWYGPVQSFSVGLGAPVSFFPIPPVTLSSSSVQGVFTLDLSDADDVAFPLWTVTGPGTQLTLTNSTTGRVIEVSADLSAGQTMTIDTRQGHQSVRRDDGTNLMGSLGSDPALWPLVDGQNVISAQLLGATAESRIEAIYRVRYAGI